MYKQFFFSILILLYILSQSLVYSQRNRSQPKYSDEWITYFEKSNFLETPSYKETMAYFEKFTITSPYAKMISIGVSPQGRDINCLIVTKGNEFTPEEAKKSSKAVILIESGIHAGEIEGKDASMLLLRDILISKEKESLLDNVILLIVPILNVDGHERISAYNRINQNGPNEMGWRTTSQNLNLNRDFMKADAPEMQSLLKLFSDWLPDFFIDSHTTDGADYQYSITYGIEKFRNIFKGTSDFLQKSFIPYIKQKIEKEEGYLVAPYIDFKDNNLKNGIVDWAALPRFSTGYAAVQNRPALLIETHMLKPYKERVFSTKAAFEASIDFINVKSLALKSLNRMADEQSIKEFSDDGDYLPIDFQTIFSKHENFLYKGLSYNEDSSWIAGERIKTYTGKKNNVVIPYYNNCIVTDSVKVPKAYLIPKQWSIITERMKLHGININELTKDTVLEVERYRFNNVKFSTKPFEGRFAPSFEIAKFNEKITVPKGTFVVYTKQRTIRCIVNLLEPKAPDSFVKWGFINSIFEQKEYFEDYSMEPIAKQMAEKDSKLKEEFQRKLAEDEAFRMSPYRRLYFFYERSKYFDKEMNLYPIMMTNSL